MTFIDTLRDELQFCETGNRFALEYLRISHDVLKDAVAAENETYLKSRIIDSFEALLSHTRHCPHCNED